MSHALFRNGPRQSCCYGVLTNYIVESLGAILQCKDFVAHVVTSSVKATLKKTSPWTGNPGHEFHGTQTALLKAAPVKV